MKRLQTSLNEKMTIMLADLTELLAVSDNEVVRTAIRELHERKIDATIDAAKEAAAGGNARGRPIGGTKEKAEYHEVIMNGNPDTVVSALIKCGFFPPGAKEIIEGDPGHFWSGKWNYLMDNPLKEIEHTIEPNPDLAGEICYVVLLRTWKDPKDPDPSTSRSVRALSRAEIWNLVKREL